MIFQRKAAALILACLTVLSSNIAYAQASPSTGAQAAALVEVSTDKVLYANNAHAKLPMASTTKIMTALLAIEYGDLDEIVTTDASAYGTEGSSIYLQLEEQMSLRDLLYGLMLSSGNDAAVAIAIYIGKGVERFTQMMNARAKEIGANNTNFVTPNGLPDENHYTTAYDLALIAAEAMKNEMFGEIVGTQYYKTTTGNYVRTFKNKNKILWQYDGGTGIKTGYTKAAGRCLVFSAERDGMELVGVVLNCSDMFNDAMRILDYGMDTYEMASLVTPDQIVSRVAVQSGTKNVLELVPIKDIMVPVTQGESISYRTVVTIYDDLTAPVEAGDVCGYVDVLDGDALLVRFDLAAAERIDAAQVDYFLGRIIRRFAFS